VKNLANDLFYSSKEFQKFFRQSPQSLVIKTDKPKFTILAVSDSFLTLVHRERADLLNRGLFDAFPGSEADPTEAVSVLNAFLTLIATKTSLVQPVFKYEIFNESVSKLETFYWNNVHEPVLDELTGEVNYIINTTTNITEQIRQKLLVEESESRFRLMAEGTDVMIAVGDEAGSAVYFNELWSTVTGRSMEELLRFGWVDLIHPDDKKVVMEIFTNAFREQLPWKWEFRMPAGEGKYNWLLARGTPRFRSDGSFAGYISSTVNITEQKEQKIQLEHLIEVLQLTNEEMAATNEEVATVNEELLLTQESLTATNDQLLIAEQTLHTAIQSANLGVWYINSETREVTASARVKEFFGFYPDEHMPLDLATDQIVEEYRDLVVAAINSAMERDEAYHIEYPIRGYHDQKIRWVRATGKLYSPGNNKPAIFSGTITDISEQKQNEERKNDFISMVSHELKTPLTSLYGYLQIMTSRALKIEDKVSLAMLSRANKQTLKMTTLINGFLNVSRLESGQIHIDKKRFDMASLIAAVESETQVSVTSHEVIFAPVESTIVEADYDKIEQVLTNLISNAVKYSPAGKTIQVACSTFAGKVLVAVADEGVGISEEDLPKLFDRFFRIANDGYQHIAGFGIGLYLCYEIIRRHEGEIWATSELGKGSRFYFSLDAVHDDVA
jgi:PAS domain S-box-containing protein